MYDPESIPPWPNFDETFEGKPTAHLRKHRQWNLQDKDWSWWQKVIAKYYGDVTLIDDCVGRVLDAIRECGIEDDTIFVFATDHGDATGSHKHFEKSGTMYDEVFRIPLLARVPRVEARQVTEFVRLMDLMPTFIEWGGGEIPGDLDAKSLVPLVHGERPADWPDSVYCESHGEVWGYSTQRMVRTERWKYVYIPHDLDELYDLEADPAEMNNLSEDPEHADVVEEMRARLIGWNDATKDMFQWKWVRWSFPEPDKPLLVRSARTREGETPLNSMPRLAISILVCLASIPALAAPNVILVMADDMGWAQTGYYNHPVLETPNLDAMAESGLRMDRFYSGAPQCSTTRATVLTGRTNDRTGVFTVGSSINKQEKTLSAAFRNAGYATAHFGKWHLNAVESPDDDPMPLSDPHNPGELGFDY